MSTQTVSDVRRIVTERVIRRAKQFPEVELSPLDVSVLSERDAGLAIAIDHGVARRWLTLACVLERCLKRPWDELEPAVQGVLLVGAAQLLLLDRVPDHAAINEAVEITKQVTRPKAAGLVNAVLRKVANLRERLVESFDRERRDQVPLGDGRAWQLTQPVFAADPFKRLAQQTAHPQVLIERWRRAFGPAKARELAAHSLVHAPILFSGANDLGATHSEPGFRVFTGSRAALESMLLERPEVLVQDPGSARPVAATATLELELIIDACAGKGTKTRQLAALHPKARIIAADADTHRAQTLREATAALPSVEVVDFAALGAFHGQADLLVLDVPCSNTGVLARRPEAKYRYSPASIEALARLQQQIVADTLALRREGGLLLYATCSLDADENERCVEWITKWHPLRVRASACSFPTGRPGDPASAYTDGGFFALLGD